MQDSDGARRAIEEREASTLAADGLEWINTYWYCGIHQNTLVEVYGNSYYCRLCGCAPATVITPDFDVSVPLSRE